MMPMLRKSRTGLKARAVIRCRRPPSAQPLADVRAVDAALTGAALPFGGSKGDTIALMVEMLAALAGGAFALDAAPFDSGSRSPGLGLFILALDPTAVTRASRRRYALRRAARPGDHRGGLAI